MKFEVGDLVRVKAKAGIPSNYHFAIGPIDKIMPGTKWPCIVSLSGRKVRFDKDELEKI